MDEFMLRDLHVAVALADICPFAALECLARMAARLRQGEGGMYEAELWCQVAFLRAELGASDGVLSDLVFLAQADSLSRVESVMDVVATLEGIDLADAVSLAAKRPADMRVLAAYLAGEFAGEAEDAQVLLRNLCRDESSKVRHAARISLRLTENSVK